jgi:hypothetical protein
MDHAYLSNVSQTPMRFCQFITITTLEFYIKLGNTAQYEAAGTKFGLQHEKLN